MAKQSTLAKGEPAGAPVGDPSESRLSTGIHEIAIERYLADPCPKPSLNADIAQILLERSPAHAWRAHPRLNPKWQASTDPRFDIGRAAHMVMLEGAARFEIIDAPDWRSEVARDERKAVAREGKIALLEHEWANVSAMVKAGRQQLAQHPEGRHAFKRKGEGLAERTIVWREGSIWCRARPDWIDAGRRFIFNYKTTAGSAKPEVWGSRQLYEIGADIQALHHGLGFARVVDKRGCQFRFVVQEIEEPFALSVIGLSATAVEVARERVREAIALWSLCQRRQKWPAYPARTAFIEPPAWHVRQTEDRKTQAEFDRESGVDPFKLSVQLYRPMKPAAKEMTP